MVVLPRIDTPSETPLKACSWCMSQPEIDALNRHFPGQVSHGICPACLALEMAKMDAEGVKP